MVFFRVFWKSATAFIYITTNCAKITTSELSSVFPIISSNLHRKCKLIKQIFCGCTAARVSRDIQTCNLGSIHTLVRQL